MNHEESKERQAEKNLQDLHGSSHPLADGITQAILGVSEVKSYVSTLGEKVSSVIESIGSMSNTVNNLHKVIAGDPIFHTDGIIQNQINNQVAALARHEAVMNKIAEIESKRLKALEDEMLSLKAYLKVWGFIATGLVTVVEIILRFVGK